MKPSAESASVGDEPGAQRAADTTFRTLERVELALRAAGIGLWEWDVAADTLRWSEEHERLAGLAPGEFGGRIADFAALVHPDDHARLAAVPPAPDEGGGFGEAYRVIWPDGSIRWLEGKGTMFRSSDGAPVAIGITHDITDRREAEQKALAILESITDAFFAVGRDWTMSYVNGAAEQLLGLPRKALLGTSVWHVPGVLQSPFEPHYRKAMDGEPAEFEAFWEAGARWLDVRVYPTATGISIYLHDVTARRRLEEELRQAQKMQAVGQLAGGVAHDFNNLLTAISGYAGLVLDRPDVPPDAQNQISEITRAAGRAAELTRQLLAFSRRQTLVPTVVDPNDLVRRATPMLKRLVGEHIEFQVQADRELRRVYADATQIEQILMNLVVNAAQAMPRGGALTISTENVAVPECRDCLDLDHGEYVALSVADTGCGMDEATASRAFEPFFTTKEQGTSTGLGLATVHGIAKQSGGSARIESAVQEGTRVTVYLPATDAEPVAAAPPGPDRGADVKGSEAVLLVDDNPTVLDVVAQMLEGHGYDVMTAVAPAEAIELVAKGLRPDVLVTDVVMPKLGGPELATTLTELHPRLRTILVSGYTAHSLLDDEMAVLKPVFLHKPFSAGELAAAVRSVLDRPDVT